VTFPLLKQVTVSQIQAIVEGMTFQDYINQEVAKLTGEISDQPFVEIIEGFGTREDEIVRHNDNVNDFIKRASADKNVHKIEIVFISDGNCKLFHFFLINRRPEVTYQFTSINGYIKICIVYDKNQE